MPNEAVEFEVRAKRKMFEELGVELEKRSFQKHPKIFDLVSNDGKIVGDAKYLRLVRGTKYPPAKMMEISAHVWMLEKIRAEKKFLVFGNQRQVAEKWL